MAGDRDDIRSSALGDACGLGHVSSPVLRHVFNLGQVRYNAGKTSIGEGQLEYESERG